MKAGKRFDVIVIGGGHAGCEAALASARLGLKTILLTLSLNKIALMPCNPSIGGIGKGHLVREIDALGGQMAKTIDKSMIQIKELNSSKGPAVRALRAQADKKLYEEEMRKTLFSQKKLNVRQGKVKEVLVSRKAARGVLLTDGTKYISKAVIIAAGTFLNGKVVIGENSWPAGRMGESPANSLSTSLVKAGIKLNRFQTATPPRVDGRSVNTSAMTVQPGQKGLRFSLNDQKNNMRQVDCHLTYTNKMTTRVVSKNMKHSPIKTGAIESHGPRYCPSIDRKILNFPDKTRHPVFVEPEGIFTNEVYLQGLTTAMPAHIQAKIIKTVEGLEKARIVRFGYAVEYDYADPRQVKPCLETKTCSNLYMAGQVIGTTGYEEAAALGLMAGINASRKIKGKQPIILRRDQAYVGVLVDDLVTKGVDEPYRMFTSRAEYRLLLRNDNSHERLSLLGKQIGLIDEKTYNVVQRQEKATEDLIEKLKKTKIKPEKAAKILRNTSEKKPKEPIRASELVGRPHTSIFDVLDSAENEEVAKKAEIRLKYGGYIKRQEADIKRSIRLEKQKVPEKIEYMQLTGLSYEAREKLGQVRPETLGQASRIPGVNPSDISVLSIHLRQKNNGRKSKTDTSKRN